MLPTMSRLTNIFKREQRERRRLRASSWRNGAITQGDEERAFSYAQQDRAITYRHLFWIFVICSVAGLLVETAVSYPIDGIWKNRAGFVWGPFSPIYGVGGVLMTLGLYHLRNRNPWVIFATGALIGGAFEFIAGWFFEAAFGIVAWSYADQPLNFGGYTCAGIAVVWGMAGFLWVKVAADPLMALVDRAPEKLMRPLTACFTLYLALNMAVTLIGFNCWYQRLDGQPVETPVQEYFAEHYGDDFMAQRFQTMSVWTTLANR